jgi:hypothetical protein
MRVLMATPGLLPEVDRLDGIELSSIARSPLCGEQAAPGPDDNPILGT